MRIRPIQKSDVKGGFSCGKPTLDAFFSARAWPQHQANAIRVYVLEDPARPGVVLGFYTLAASTVERERARPVVTGSALPPHPLPVFYIGFLAVARGEQRQGHGRRLMGDALRRCLSGAESIGAVGVFLDSLDDDSTAFYQSLGFQPLQRAPNAPGNGPLPMLLSMRELQASKPEGW